MKKKKKSKKIYDVELIVVFGKPYIQIEIDDTKYRAEFNPFMSKDAQVDALIQQAEFSRNQELLQSSKSFEDYMFAKLMRERIMNNEKTDN